MQWLFSLREFKSVGSSHILQQLSEKFFNPLLKKLICHTLLMTIIPEYTFNFWNNLFLEKFFYSFLANTNFKKTPNEETSSLL